MISHSGHYLRPAYLKGLADTYRDVYKQAKPFPHLVIDEFLPVEVLDRVLNEFPKATTFGWQSTDGPVASNLPKSEGQMGETTYKLLLDLNSPTFIGFLEQLTDTDGIMADPALLNNQLNTRQPDTRSLDASPSSDILLKGFAEPHCYARQYLDRKLNLLIYLNKGWKEEYGGHLELWNAEMTRCEKRILPIFNRCVIFSTTDFSYHGHPEPLNCPDGESRKLLMLSYYSRTGDRNQPHPPPVKAAHSSPPDRVLPQLIPEVPRQLKNNVLVFRSNPASKD
jgi:hypothetical protein